MRNLASIALVLTCACGPLPTSSDYGSGIRYDLSCPCLPHRAPSGLAFDPAYMWDPRSVLNVCFDGGSAQMRGWVQDAISKTWGLASRLRLTWTSCSKAAVQNVHIGFGQALEIGCVGVGINHVSPGLTLGTYRNDERDLRMQAVFGFGFVLGFAAGQDRFDSQCDHIHRFPEFAVRVLGPWDPSSTMNECRAPTYNWGLLSDGDISGMQQIYGEPDATCQCPDS